MRGTNPIRKPMKGNGEALEVQEIFATFQGEGPNTGVPAVFVRLGGCNLACSFCDTEFESFKSWATDDVIAEVERLSLNKAGKRVRSLVVLTGGEPLRQPIDKFCKRLLDNDYHMQIETNGTLMRPLDKRVEIICSPKNTGKGYVRLRDDVLQRTKALKFIISASDLLYRDVGDVGQREYNTPVYVQPMDEYDPAKNAANTSRALELAQKHGYRLSIQMHKLVGIP